MGRNNYNAVDACMCIGLLSSYMFHGTISAHRRQPITASRFEEGTCHVVVGLTTLRAHWDGNEMPATACKHTISG